MQFYSGFSLCNEEHFFEFFLDKSDFCVSGFSYGAIKALKEAETRVQNGQRVDKLQLLSPAFFQTKSAKFMKLQLMAYSKNKEAYLQEFLRSCFHPYAQGVVHQVPTRKEELEDLLFFQWPDEVLENLQQKGVTIEVYLGSEDKIIDVENAREFFLKYATVSYIKGANHFLQKESRV